MTTMRIALIVLTSSILLAQGVVCKPYDLPTPYSLVNDAVDSATSAVKELGLKVTGLVKEASEVVQKYIAKSTDYSNTFKVNAFKELDNTVAMYNKAMAEAELIAATSNRSVVNCQTANISESLVQRARDEIVSCVLLKLKHFIDLAAKLVGLGNDIVMLIPNTVTKSQNCTNSGSRFSKLECVTVTMSQAIVKLSEMAMSVASIATSASIAYSTLSNDLAGCAVSPFVKITQDVLRCLSKNIGR